MALKSNLKNRFHWKLTAAGSLTLLLLMLFPVKFASAAKDLTAQKLPGVLAGEVRYLRANPRFDYAIPVIVMLDPAASLDQVTRSLALGGRRVKPLPLVHGYATRMTAAQITVASPRLTSSVLR